MKSRLMYVVGILALSAAPAAFAASTDTGTTDLQVTVGPEASFSVGSGTTTLAAADTKFGGYSGTTSFTYKIRTSQTTGTGSIVVQVTAFATGGPAIADLSYTCTAASGTACATSTTASTSSGTNIVTFGADAHSADTGDAGSTAWALVDRPSVKTGSYDSTATYTISAT
jgi:hypothetical protein